MIFKYPKKTNFFSTDIIPIIRIMWKTKFLMETTMKTIENRQKKTANVYSCNTNICHSSLFQQI
ncbi:hypothetical protein BD408DRAFT_420740 [Parasitella parasitica]|nr:hypothetical protein BD408DRAFT_420740 [Parasitella parasitica]